MAGFQCATARVPLDYHHPGGAKISLAVVRHLATGHGRRLGSLFINGGGPGEQIDALLDHDTSADVARDMDLLRAAVGDPVLNYLGISYGTGIGAVYANLFPARVGRMVLDANLDPVAWTRSDGKVPYALREGIDEANAADLTAFP